jgi:putative hydrolase of the HAD superfamily
MTSETKIRNVVFDVGGVLLDWNPPAIVAGMFDDPKLREHVQGAMFGHADWHEVDRGTLDGPPGVAHFSRATGLPAAQVEELLARARASLTPIVGTVRILEELAAAKVKLYVLSNMPVTTYHFLMKRDGFFRHFDHMVISGAINMLKPEPEIYAHLVEKTGITPAESVFIDDLERNVVAARAAGLHAIRFASPEQCRAELRRLLPQAGL